MLKDRDMAIRAFIIRFSVFIKNLSNYIINSVTIVTNFKNIYWNFLFMRAE